MTLVRCVDVGSTWTKAALVSADGELLGTAQHPTTAPEVLDGIARVTAALSGAAAAAPVLACSSAGGGLRLVVVGQEPLVSAEAGRRVALTAGARVVHVHAGALDGAGIRTLRAARPDVLLLVGGTDGGDARTLLHNAARLAVNRVRPPIVLAGNADARDDALALLRSTNRTVVVADNVLPDVGELNPGPARQAIREAFLHHVIGGKGLSRGPRFRRLVRMVTPDAVLLGVSRLPGAVLVVDVGGATTDVYTTGPTGRQPPAAGLAAQRRTVEGDLGMRISAVGVVTEAAGAKLVDAAEAAGLRAATERRAAEPATLPSTVDDAAIDVRLATLAALIAIRRHLRVAGAPGADSVVLSGGVFRHAGPGAIGEVGDTLRADPVLRPMLRRAAIHVDRDYVLAPAGLLADAGLTAAADALLARIHRPCRPPGVPSEPPGTHFGP